MPKSSRRLTPRQRAERRRRRETGAAHPISAPAEMATAPEAALSSPAQSASEAVAPRPAAVPARPSRAVAAASARAVRPTLRQDPFLTTELRRIGLMSAFIFAILVALSVVLS